MRRVLAPRIEARGDKRAALRWQTNITGNVRAWVGGFLPVIL
jgi:hypothetical protein